MVVTKTSPAVLSPQVTPARNPSNPPVQTPTPERVRQGRNIRGMVTVLVVSIVVLLAAYGVMLALLGGQADTSPNADLVSETNATAASETGPDATSASSPAPPVTQSSVQGLSQAPQKFRIAHKHQVVAITGKLASLDNRSPQANTPNGRSSLFILPTPAGASPRVGVHWLCASA